MMLALGDALAVALLRLKGFTQDDFHIFHPGGRLGQSLRRVRDIMHRDKAMPLVPAGMCMSEALIEMSSKGFGCTGVMNADGELVGIITDGDLRRHMSTEMLGRPVQEVMTPDPNTIHPDALAAQAV